MSSRRRGLPTEARMRHDSHFVESLAERFGEALGRFVPIEEIETNPEQPRTSVGDLRELVKSIESKGVLEPLLVRPTPEGRLRIIAGERRFRAALEAGLAEVPCIELDVPDSEVLEIALIENLHRKDLHPFEEADGLAGLTQRHGYTQQQVADAIGKSRVSVTEAMSLLDIPDELREECRRADRFSFVYKPKGGPYKLALSFAKSRVEKSELVHALKEVIKQLEAGEIKLPKR